MPRDAKIAAQGIAVKSILRSGMGLFPALVDLNAGILATSVSALAETLTMTPHFTRVDLGAVA